MTKDFFATINELSKLILDEEINNPYQFNKTLLENGWYRVFPRDSPRNRTRHPQARAGCLGYERPAIVATRHGYYLHDPRADYDGRELSDDNRLNVAFYFTQDPNETAEDFWDFADEEREMRYGYMWVGGGIQRRIT